MGRLGKGNRIQDPATIQDMYLDYIKEFEEESPYYITYLEYRDITT
jgi:hypothetical protein